MQLTADGIEAEWSRAEVAAAMVDLADHHMLAVLANQDVDVELVDLKAMRNKLNIARSIHRT